MTPLRKRLHHFGLQGYRKQQGLVAIFVTMAFLFIAGIAAFAIDMNHAYMNKSKLQNAVDSAALAAAVVINNEHSVVNGAATVTETLDKIINSGGNSELLNIDNSTYLKITYSDDPTDKSAFSTSYSGSGDYIYIRVAISGYPINNFISHIFGVDKYVSASAVAGPSAPVGPDSIIPVAMCDKDPDGNNYEENKIYAVVSGELDIGSGNFQFLDFGGDTSLSENLAGGYDGDVSQGVWTEPGENTGPVLAGMNSRLGDTKDQVSSVYPPDKYVKQPFDINKNDAATLVEDKDTGEVSVSYSGDWYYSDYKTEKEECDADPQGCTNSAYYNEDGAADRRTLVVPVIDCTQDINGTTYVQIEGYKCFFLLQEMDKQLSKLVLFGEFIANCPISPSGTYDLDNGNQFRIVLFNDPFSEGA